MPLFAYIAGGQENRSKSFLVLYTAFLAFFVGMSDMLGGYDRYIYGNIFDNIADNITNGIPILSSDSFLYYEVGYSLLSTFIAFFTENRYIFILILTLIIYYNLYKTFERHINNYPLAFILFLGMMFFFTFTYLRQVIAFSFAWLSIKYLLEGNKIKFFCMVVLVALIHKSGIVFACLYFIPIKKWKPNQIRMILLGCAVIGLSGIVSGLYNIVMASGFIAGEGNDYNASGSARIAYILEVFFFVWIILKNYEKIEKTRVNMIFLNMAWMFCGSLLLFVRSSDGGRVAWFFVIGIVYIITKIAITTQMKGVRFSRNYVGVLMVVVMLILYVRVFNAWQDYNNLYPYKTFLSNGRRIPDYSYERYEYDYNYEVNKFYRPAFRFMK